MNYKDYIKLGINHHLLYNNVCSDPQGHYDSLMKLNDDERFEVLDIWIPEENPWHQKEVQSLLSVGKDVYYNVGTRKGKEPAHPATLNPEKKKYSLDFYKGELDRAIEVRAKKIITNSGPDVPDNREAAFEALVDFYCEICEYVGPDILIMVEPTDREVDKCKFIGPSIEAVKLAKRINENGFKNFASMVDMGHLPLMGETIEQAMRDSDGYIGHIHLGNCILKDKDNPMFGDKHVAWGLDGGEYDLINLAEILSIGINTGYFNNQERGSASFEMRPYPDMSAEISVEIFFDKLEKAWQHVKHNVNVEV